MGTEEMIRIIPLGGLGEVGKNMMIFEYRDMLLVIDAGLKFLEDQRHGIDFTIPDFSYLIARKDKVRAIILTHGHEDHIGALPYLLKEINVPIYGTKLTLGFVRNRLDEYLFDTYPAFVEIVPRQRVPFGSCEVEFFRVCHSIPDGVGLAFHTPLGLIIHSGDFKIDFTTILGEQFDLSRLAELGEKGVLLLMSDSTNAEKEGYTPSEHRLNGLLSEAITRAAGRVIISTFASNVHRIQQIFDICNRTGRKVALFGMSMEKHIAMARSLGYLKFDERDIISSSNLNSFPRARVCILTTGSQGEPMSALSRFVKDRYKTVEIEQGDTVILSASIIPGNEKTVSGIVNEIFRKGASVYYEGFEDLHVSGHASKEELKLMLAVTRPRYFIPIHGEFRHLIHHAGLARQVGISEKNILIAEDGDVITIDGKGIFVSDRVVTDPVYIDTRGAGDIESGILKERQKISRDGIVIVVLLISSRVREVMYPEVVAKGLVHTQVRAELLEKVKNLVFDTAVDHMNATENRKDRLELLLRERLTRFFRKETGIVPLIVPLVIETS
jgi:ribonuclease J